MSNPVVRAYGPGTTRSSETLYERMGGEERLEALVDGAYKMCAADKELGKQFKRFRLERLKDRTVDYLRGEFGGPAYKGPDLWISHSHMGVNNKWYDIMLKAFAYWIKKLKFGKQEAKEIMEALEKFRTPIVDPGLKLKEMYLQWERREADKNGGDGWTVVSNNRKDKEKKEKETLEKLRKLEEEEMMAKEARKLKEAEALDMDSIVKTKNAPASKAAGPNSSDELSPTPKAKAAPKAAGAGPSDKLSPTPKARTAPKAADTESKVELPPQPNAGVNDAEEGTTQRARSPSVKAKAKKKKAPPPTPAEEDPAPKSVSKLLDSALFRFCPDFDEPPTDVAPFYIPGYMTLISRTRRTHDAPTIVLSL